MKAVMKLTLKVILFIGMIIMTGCQKSWNCECITTTYSYEESGNWWSGTTTTTTTTTTPHNYTINAEEKSDAKTNCKAKENSNTTCNLK